MVKLKGVGLVASKTYISGKFGQEAVGKVINSLNEEDRILFSETILANEYYPLDSYVHWLEQVCNVLYNGDESIILQQTKESTEQMIQGVHHIYLSLGSVEKVLDRLGTINLQYFENVRATITPIEEGKVLLTYFGFEKQHRIFELVLKGWWLSILKLLGATNTKFESKVPIGEGKSKSEYILSWTK